MNTDKNTSPVSSCAGRSRSIRRAVATAIATGLFSGRLPVSPGTWGSLCFLCLWLALKSLGLLQSTVVELAVIALLAIGGYFSTAECLKSGHGGSSKTDLDPPSIVIDEWLGMMISLVVVAQGEYGWAFAAFALFRFFDILKPGPIRSAEKLPGALGIMADDALAGIFAAVSLELLRLVF